MLTDLVKVVAIASDHAVDILEGGTSVDPAIGRGASIVFSSVSVSQLLVPLKRLQRPFLVIGRSVIKVVVE